MTLRLETSEPTTELFSHSVGGAPVGSWRIRLTYKSSRWDEVEGPMLEDRRQAVVPLLPYASDQVIAYSTNHCAHANGNSQD